MVLAGVLLRLPRLDLRPLHVDEAVHAVKFGDLLERHTYRYDPVEYHGPTLNYFTLIPARLASEATLIQVHERTLRIVPVVFGILLILLPVLIDESLPPFILVAALLTGLSGNGVYSRYYIQEMLLVSFTFGAIASALRYFQDRKWGWAALAGIFLGLMHATKETSIIALGCNDCRGGGSHSVAAPGGTNLAAGFPAHALVALICAAATSVLFFSRSSPTGRGSSIPSQRMERTSEGLETRGCTSIPGTIICRCSSFHTRQVDPSGPKPSYWTWAPLALCCCSFEGTPEGVLKEIAGGSLRCMRFS